MVAKTANMKHVFVTGVLILLFLSSSTRVEGQVTPTFSGESGAFMKELRDFFKASGRRELDNLFKDFEKLVKQGQIGEDSYEIIREQAMAMRERNMSASPYFEAWFNVLVGATQAGIQESRLREWMDIYGQELAAIEKSKFKPVKDFLDFSSDYFLKGALRYSSSGISWYADPRKGRFAKEEDGIVLIFEPVDITAARRQDSIQLFQTKGRYYPASAKWKGEGGFVDWRRFENTDIRCDLSNYEIDLTQSIYEAENTLLTYPLLFGDRKLPGKVTDKVLARNLAVEGSYPKFEAYEKIVEIEDIGGGISYSGGFRLEGTSLYGFGRDGDKAWITLENPPGCALFLAESDQFTLKREELVVGSRVATTIYFGKDSIVHPSTDFRFEIPRRVMRLTRSNRASDKAPFYSSLHKFDFDVDDLTWFLNRDTIQMGARSIAGTKGKEEVQVISQDFFSDEEYRKIQSIADINPLLVIKRHLDETGDRIVAASTLAYKINPSFDVENIQSLLFDLVKRGFIFYDFERGLVEIKPKLEHYVLSSQDKQDFDFLYILSITRDDNAIFSMRDSGIVLYGVPFVEFSQPRQVAVRPYGQEVRLGVNRNMDFNGRLFAGSTVLDGSNMHFDYQAFSVKGDSIRTFDIYIPTGQVDKDNKPISLAIASRIENFSGVLQIDAPENKAGKRAIPLFPALQTSSQSFIYYDQKEIQEGVYHRDSFYFEIDPFTFNSLDQFTGPSLRFRGRLISDDIFPVIEETAVLMPDSSLGFVNRTPEAGLPTYVGRGKHTGDIILSNRGLEGKGLIQYLRASAFSEDVVFRPQQMIGSARQFDIEEDRQGPIFMPKVEGRNVLINWLPYRDSMYVTSQEKAFDFYEGATHTLSGMLILTPDGLRGRGTFDWAEGYIESDLLAFGAHDVDSDTLDLKIRALGEADLAFDTRNVNGRADFDEQYGRFRANSEELNTVMPYNRYQTSMNEFEWDMAQQTITFKSDPGKLANFLCTDPAQDSLTFKGDEAFYDLKSNVLQVAGVPEIFSADAFIYPSDGKVEIRGAGAMTAFEDARIVADTVSKYHVINRASVQVFGKRHYEAKGFYEYNVGPYQQEIEFEKIVGYPIGKGKASEKKAVTRAEGTVMEEDQFRIDFKTRFQGKIHLEADSPDLTFEGFAFLDAERLNRKNWFSINSRGDKNNLVINYKSSRNPDGEPARTGFFINRSTSYLYPSVMTMLFLRRDRPVLEVDGMFRYDRPGDMYYFGDSTKVVGTGRRGNLFTFSNNTGSVYGEGRMTLGSGLDLVNIDAAGTIKSSFNVPDSLVYGEEGPPKVVLEVMTGIEMHIPEALVKIMLNDLTKSYEGAYIDYVSDPFIERYLATFIEDDAQYTETTNIMRNRALALPESFKKYSLFLPKVSLTWNHELQSFLSTGDQIGVAAIQNQMLNRFFKGYLEIRMPSNEDDRLYLLLRSGSEYFYFFGYRGGILSITSNNTEFMDASVKLKAKDLVLKRPDDKVYEIQFVGPETAELWMRRIQNAER